MLHVWKPVLLHFSLIAICMALKKRLCLSLHQRWYSEHAHIDELSRRTEPFFIPSK